MDAERVQNGRMEEIEGLFFFFFEDEWNTAAAAAVDAHTQQEI